VLTKSDLSSSGKLKKTCFLVFICYLLVSTLVTNESFISSSVTPLYTYLIGVSFVIIFAAINLYKTKLKLPLPWPIVVAIIWGAYIFINGYFISNNFNTYHLYLILNCGLFVSLYFLLSTGDFNINWIFNLILVLLFIESSVCILQYFRLFHSYSKSFAVTGTWENPNVTAMFLAMGLPIVVNLIFSKDTLPRTLAFFLITILIFAIGVLGCRTAILGAVTCIIVYLIGRFDIINSFLKIKGGSKKVLLLGTAMLIAISCSFYLYNAKKASAEGRKLIWSLSLNMAFQKPVSGYGYGSFEKNYNLYQYEYFKNGHGTLPESTRAASVNMAYNEFIQNSVEGGIIGFILFSALIACILFLPIKSNNTIRGILPKTEPKGYLNIHGFFLPSYAGIAAFVIMSFFNFSLQAMPVICLFGIYLAHLSCDQVYQPKLFKKITISTISINLTPLSRAFIAYPLGLFGLAGFCYTISITNEILLTAKAVRLSKKGNYRAAEIILNPLTEGLKTHKEFWIQYGDILYACNDYAAALDKYNQALKYTSRSEVYLKAGLCNYKLNNLQNAKTNFSVAKFIEPNKMAPRVNLMLVNWASRDTINAITEANDIIRLSPKISSSKTDYFKRVATNLLLVAQSNHIKSQLKDYKTLY